MVEATVVTGVIAPSVALWVADMLPKPGEPRNDAERKVKYLVVSALAGVGIAYIAMKAEKGVGTVGKS